MHDLVDIDHEGAEGALLEAPLSVCLLHIFSRTRAVPYTLRHSCGFYLANRGYDPPTNGGS